MKRSLPPALAALPLALVTALLAMAGRAQEAPSARFAFSDTTLLRDTLNLDFRSLFPLADSLRISPERLRMLSVRYRLPLARMVWLSDSLRMPVDSVGAVMERERFNPLSASTQRLSAFSYNSAYQVTQEGRASWGNGTEYVFSSGGMHVRNVTNVDIERQRGELTAISRASETSADWRYSKRLSAGARVFLRRDQGFGFSPGLNSSSNNNEYQLKMNSQQQPRPNLRSGFNLFLGPFNEPLTENTSGKRGISGQMSGNLEYNHKGWLIYDVDGRLTTRIGTARMSNQPSLDLREFFGTFRGNLSFYERTPVSLRFGHELQRNRAESPDTIRVGPEGADSLQYFLRRLPSGTATMSLALNLRHGNRGSLTVTGELENSERLLKIGGVGRTSASHNASIRLDGRYLLAGWNIDAHFSDARPVVEDPQRISRTAVRNDTGGPDTVLLNIDFRQKTETRNRSLDVTVDRALSRKLSVRAKGRVFLGQPRSSITDSSYRSRPEISDTDIRAFPTEPRDSYDDALELQGIYTPSGRLTTSLSLELSTRDVINLLAVSSSRNTHIRTYRTQWSWSYRLMSGLTATQRNQLTADYTYFPFARNQDQLAMKFDVRTTLNALVNSRFRIDLTHVSEESPKGSYVAGALDDRSLFRVNSRNRAYNLSTNITYTPVQALSLTLNPAYRADAAAGSGVQKSLSVAGGGSVNFELGRHGGVSGNMSRTYTVRSSASDARSRGTYSWSGSLQLTWKIE